MKKVSSLKSIALRDPKNTIKVRRGKRVYLINRVKPRIKARQG